MIKKTKTYKNYELSESLSSKIFLTNSIELVNFIIDRMCLYREEKFFFYFISFSNKIYYLVEDGKKEYVESGFIENNLVEPDQLIHIKAENGRLQEVW